MLDLAAPAIVLLVIAVVHIGYFLLVRGVVTQQTVHVAAFPAPRAVLPPAGRSEAALRGAPLRLADARPIRRARPMRVADGVYRQPLICGRGLAITGEALFTEPVKVVGDLVITGRVVFRRPVVVTGDARVLGDAVFQQGLLIKSELLIFGHVIIGGEGQQGWLVARQARVRGGLWLNGEFESAHTAVRDPEVA
jgi:hypothetical protein